LDKVLLDTDIFSEVLKGIDSHVVAQATAYRAIYGRYTISTITVLEIVKGLHKVQREDRIQQFLDGLTTIDILTLDLQSAELAGRIYADLERTGQPIGRADPIIASIASSTASHSSPATRRTTSASRISATSSSLTTGDSSRTPPHPSIFQQYYCPTSVLSADGSVTGGRQAKSTKT
jgi:tRNA(fMet)-specific endonuclease VapC